MAKRTPRPDAADDDAGDLWAAARQLALGGIDAPAARLRLSADFPDISEDELSAVVRAAFAVPTALPDLPAAKAGSGPDGSEAAMAEYLAGSDLPSRLRWSADEAAPGWYAWTGTHWQRTSAPVPLALQTAVRRALADGLDSRRFTPKDASRLETAGALRGVTCLLQDWPTMRLSAVTDPHDLLVCPMGVLDLVHGHMLPHDPARAVTRCCPVNPGPTCDLWNLIESHLKTCLGDRYAAFHRFMGSSLLGRASYRKLAWLQGPGGDGKSQLARALRAALGHYAASISPEVLRADGRTGSHGHELASNMAGARLGLAGEVEGRVDLGLLKNLSGGDEQTSKRSRGRLFTYDRAPLLLVISNDLPAPPALAEAQRVILAEVTPPEDQDERIAAVLSVPGPERDIIGASCLSWLLRGCADYLANGLGPVPLMAFEDVGLDRWWREAVESGRIIPGKGSTNLDSFMVDFTQSPGMACEERPHARAMAGFLRTRVSFRRDKVGRWYGASFKTAGDA